MHKPTLPLHDRGYIATVHPLELWLVSYMYRVPQASFSEIMQASVEERTDPGLIKEKLRIELRRFFRKRSGRRPFVLPVIMEI